MIKLADDQKTVKSGDKQKIVKAREEEAISLQDFLTLLNSEDSGKVITGFRRFNKLAHKFNFSAAGFPLLNEYLIGSPQCIELFRTLDRWNNKDIRVCASILQWFSQLFIFKPSIPQKGLELFVGRKLIRKYMKMFKWLFQADDYRNVVKTLKFLEALVQSGKTTNLAREFAHALDFKQKAFLQIPVRKYPTKETEDPQAARSAFIRFSLAYLHLPDGDLVNFILQKGFLTGLLRGLPKDPILTIEYAIRSFEALLKHPGLSIQTRIGFFNPWVIEHLCKLYTASEETALYAHQLMQALLSEIEQSLEQNQALWKHHKQALLVFLGGVVANEHGLLQQLVLSVLQRYPRLIRLYLRQLTSSFEPRPTLKWMLNVNFLQQIYLIPLDPNPKLIKLKQSKDTDNNAESKKSTLMESIFPKSLEQVHLQRGFGSSNVLVVYTTLKLLLAIFRRYAALKPPNSSGSATPEHQLLLRKHVPDLGVLTHAAPLLTSEAMQAMFLSLLWNYHVHLPEVVLESRFDVWKLLTVPLDSLTPLCQYRLLKLLRCSDTAVTRIWTHHRDDDQPSGPGVAAGPTNLRRVLNLYVYATHSAVKQEALELLVQIFKSTGLFVVLSLDHINVSRDLEAAIWLECLTPSVLDFFEDHLVKVALLFVMVEPGVFDPVCSPLLQFALARSLTPEAIQYACRVCLRLLHSGISSPAYLESLLTCLTSKRKKLKKTPVIKQPEQTWGIKRARDDDDKTPANKKSKMTNGEVARKGKDNDEKEENEEDFEPPPPEYLDLAEFVRRKLKPPAQFLVSISKCFASPALPKGLEEAVLRGPADKFAAALPSICAQQSDFVALTDVFLAYKKASLFSFSSVLAVLSAPSAASAVAFSSSSSSLSSSTATAAAHSASTAVVASSPSAALLQFLQSLPPTLLVTHLSANGFQELQHKGVQQLFLSSGSALSAYGQCLLLLDLAQHLAAHSQATDKLSLSALSQASLCFEAIFQSLSSHIASAATSIATTICESLSKSLKYLLPCELKCERLSNAVLVLAAVACIHSLQRLDVPLDKKSLVASVVVFPWVDLVTNTVRDVQANVSLVNQSVDAYPSALVILRTFADYGPETKLRELMKLVVAGNKASDMLSLIGSYFPLAQHLFAYVITVSLETLSYNLDSGKNQNHATKLISNLLTTSANHPLSDVMSCVHPRLVVDCFQNPSESAGMVVAHCLQSRFAAFFAREFTVQFEKLGTEERYVFVSALSAYLCSPHVDTTLLCLHKPKFWKCLVKWGMSAAEPLLAEAARASLRLLVRLDIVLPSNFPDAVERCLANYAEDGKKVKKLSPIQLEICGFLLQRGFTGYGAFIYRGLVTLRAALKAEEGDTQRMTEVLSAVIKAWQDTHERKCKLVDLCEGDVTHESLTTALNNLFSVVLNSVGVVSLTNVVLLRQLLSLQLAHPLPGVMPPRAVYDLLASSPKFIEVMVFPSVIGEAFKPLSSTTPSAPLQLKTELVAILTLLFGPSTAHRVDDLSEDLQSNLLSVLCAGYQGTDMVVDKKTLLLLQMFPAAGDNKEDKGVFPDGGIKWGRGGFANLLAQMSEDEEVSEDTMWVYENFDKNVLSRGPPEITHTALPKELHYDPFFLLDCLIDLFKRQAVDCNRTISSQLVSYIVLCLSATDLAVRKLAYTALAMFQQMLDSLTSDDPSLIAAMRESFPELPQVRVLMNVLKNAITEEFMLIPAIATSFVARSFHVVISPAHYLYKSINRFLLARPALDFTDVPMFYSLFNTSSNEYRKERSWLLWMLLQGLVHDKDFEALNRRFAFPTLMSFHDSNISDNFTREIVLSLFRKTADNPVKLLELVEHHGLLTWLSASVSEVRNLHSVRLLLSTLYSIVAVLVQPQAWVSMTSDATLETRLVRARMECLAVLQILPALFQRFSMLEATLPSETDPLSLVDIVLNIVSVLSTLLATMKESNATTSSAFALLTYNENDDEQKKGSSKQNRKKKRKFAMPLRGSESGGISPSFFTSLFTSFAFQYTSSASTTSSSSASTSSTTSFPAKSSSLFEALFSVPLSISLQSSAWLRDVEQLIISSFLFMSSAMTSCSLAQLHSANNASSNNNTSSSNTCLCEVFPEWVEWLWHLIATHRSLRIPLVDKIPDFMALYSLLTIAYRHKLAKFTSSEVLISSLRKQHVHTQHKINSLLLVLHCQAAAFTKQTKTLFVTSVRPSLLRSDSLASSTSITAALSLPHFPLDNPLVPQATFSLSSFPTLICSANASNTSISPETSTSQHSLDQIKTKGLVSEALLNDLPLANIPAPSAKLKLTPGVTNLLDFVQMQNSCVAGSLPSKWKEALQAFQQ